MNIIEDIKKSSWKKIDYVSSQVTLKDMLANKKASDFNIFIK